MNSPGDSALLLKRMIAFELVATHSTEKATIGAAQAAANLAQRMRSRQVWAEDDQAMIDALASDHEPADGLLQHLMCRFER
jgi:hypothetical protein